MDIINLACIFPRLANFAGFMGKFLIAARVILVLNTQVRGIMRAFVLDALPLNIRPTSSLAGLDIEIKLREIAFCHKALHLYEP